MFENLDKHLPASITITTTYYYYYQQEHLLANGIYRKATFLCAGNNYMYVNLSNWPVDKPMQFLCILSVSCIVMYGTIKIYEVQIYSTGA